MRLPNPFQLLPSGWPFGSVLPDLLLSFSFFTALSYAVFGQRFGRERTTVAMSVSIGLALSIGLVWWEYGHGWSVRDLGPVAIGLALVALAGAAFSALRQVGGVWAGAGVALATCLLIGSTLGIDWPGAADVVGVIALVALLIGIFAVLLHRDTSPVEGRARSEVRTFRHTIRETHRSGRLAALISARLSRLRVHIVDARSRPELADGAVQEVEAILPVEGRLTERLSTLRAMAWRFRNGHAAQIDELRAHLSELSDEARQTAEKELAARYQELNFDTRLDRLDAAVAEVERRVRDLTQQVRIRLQAGDRSGALALVDEATRLQQHVVRLTRLIERTEKRLLAAAITVLKKSHEVTAE